MSITSTRLKRRSTIFSQHGLVFILNFIAKGSRGAVKKNLSIIGIIGHFVNTKTESCTLYVETIIDKAFELGFPMPDKLDAQKKCISRAIKWGIENLPGFSRALNSKRNCFGEYLGRRASTFHFDFKIIEDYFSGLKPVLEKKMYQGAKSKVTKAEKKAYFAEKAANQNKMSSKVRISVIAIARFGLFRSLDPAVFLSS
ncbi:hypothetical protein JKP31_16100, partial [Vibrio vulnificus]|uniref:hypothetical protein n=1 Tax=Vibrio vulnificus TaxID=672 RepID=UPI001CDCAE4E